MALSRVSSHHLADDAHLDPLTEDEGLTFFPRLAAFPRGVFVGVMRRDKRVERPEPLEGVLARISNLLASQNCLPIGFGAVWALDTVSDSLGLAYALGQG